MHEAEHNKEHNKEKCHNKHKCCCVKRLIGGIAIVVVIFAIGFIAGKMCSYRHGYGYNMMNQSGYVQGADGVRYVLVPAMPAGVLPPPR